MNTVSVADLAGYLDVASGNQGFVLPIFAAPSVSNAYQVQVRGRKWEVKAFKDLASDEKITHINAKETISIGSEMMWIFQIAPGILVIERASKFRSALRKSLLQERLKLAPYARWEVERLFGSIDDRRTSILALQDSMKSWNAKLARYWIHNLFILPTIREKLENALIDRAQDGSLAEAIDTLQISCNASGVKLRSNETLAKLMLENKEVIQVALKEAADEWEGTGIGSRCSMGRVAYADAVPAQFIPREIIQSHAHEGTKGDKVVSFRDGQITFDRTWAPHERALIVGILEEIAQRFGNAVERTIVTGRTRNAPGTSITYFTQKMRTPTSSRTADILMARKPAHHRLKIICATDPAIVRESLPKRAASRFETNVLLFRNREEAEQVLVEFEDARALLETFSQIWIAEPKGSPKQLGIGSLRRSLTRKIMFLGYLALPRIASGRRFRDIPTDRFFLVVTEDPSRVDAAVITNFLSVAKLSAEPGPIDIVVCVVNGKKKRHSLKRISRSIRLLYVDLPPADLIQRARAIFCHLSSFSAGIFGSTRQPLVFVRRAGDHDTALTFAASVLDATIVDVSVPALEANRPAIRAALSTAARRGDFGDLKRRYTASRGRIRAAELYGQLIGLDQRRLSYEALEELQSP